MNRQADKTQSRYQDVSAIALMQGTQR
ncbi:hypothetical protein XHV734_3379 [Xanthomonas hortorum pv. vitians]|nr:hypothetical protein XHV734_3379 [Xanthomonas hortorum pv. vitians]